MLFSVLLAPTAAFADATAPAAPAAAEQNAATPAAPAVAPGATDPAQAAGAAAPADETGVVLEEDNTLGMAHDLSPWGMYQNADVVVKAVMIGLAIASIITWTIWIAKGFELLGAKRRLRAEIVHLKKATTLKEASETATKKGTLANLLVHDALEEMRLSANTREKEGIKERVSFRLERLVAACGRNMSSGTGVLATIGSTRALRRPVRYRVGHHEQLHRHRQNPDHQPRRRCPPASPKPCWRPHWAWLPPFLRWSSTTSSPRSIAGYKAQVSDASAEVLLLVSRDLDHLPTERSSQPHMVKVG